MTITIRSRWDDMALWTGEAADLRDAVIQAVAARADLFGANLSWANLSGANLSWANLSGANLSGANLSWADLSGANLSKADLSRANLSGANLSWAYLFGANLSWADLSRAYLSGANLSEANLSEANLSAIRDDLCAVLTSVPHEAPAVLAALREGRVDGSTYQGECACLVGTVANARHCDYKGMPELRPNSDRPIERWFLAIRKGDTPETTQVCRITAEWTAEWLAAHPQQQEAV